MTKTLRRALLAAVALFVVAASAAAPAAWAHNPEGLDAIGLAAGGTELVAFRTNDTGSVVSVGAVTGLVGDGSLVGIDYRVQNNGLYGVGNAGGVYLIDDATAAATKVGQLTVVLLGTSFGLDVNPDTDALRIISSIGQNLRQPFGPGDGTAGPTMADPVLNRSGAFGPASGITAAAYTRNDLDPDTSAQLYDLDTVNNRLALQFPENQGFVSGIGPNGRLDDIQLDAGLDIFSRPDDDGTSVDDDGYAVVTVGTENRLLTVDLFDGEQFIVGTFDRADITDLAIKLNS